MKLTNQQKIEAYQYAITRLTDEINSFYDLRTEWSPAFPNHRGICTLLAKYLIHMDIYIYNELQLKHIFPEFFFCKPSNVMVESYWWERDEAGATIRIAALEWCIEQVKKTKINIHGKD